jgi:prepilin-type N-terminal cleavage/methylation domain-containing protein
MRTRHAKRAFTLIEILIVVVILGILAAIVIPQFTSASEEAEISAAKSTLSTIRSQFELFKFKENQVPAAFADMWTGGPITGDTYIQGDPDTDNYDFELADTDGDGAFDAVTVTYVGAGVAPPDIATW